MVPSLTRSPLRASESARSVASLVCFNNNKNCMRLVFPDELVPNTPVILPQGMSARVQDLKFVKRISFNMISLRRVFGDHQSSPYPRRLHRSQRGQNTPRALKALDDLDDLRHGRESMV